MKNTKLLFETRQRSRLFMHLLFYFSFKRKWFFRLLLLGVLKNGIHDGSRVEKFQNTRKPFVYISFCKHDYTFTLRLKYRAMIQHFSFNGEWISILNIRSTSLNSREHDFSRIQKITSNYTHQNLYNDEQSKSHTHVLDFQIYAEYNRGRVCWLIREMKRKSALFGKFGTKSNNGEKNVICFRCCKEIEHYFEFTS